MALIKCPECGKDVSTKAKACPHCGYPINQATNANPISYDTKIVKIRCWGPSDTAIDRELQPYTQDRWEVVTMVEDHWLSGLASPVYKVTLRRAKR